MRTFGRSDKEASELSEARQEINALKAKLALAGEEAEARDREIRELKANVQRMEIRLADMKQGGKFMESHGVLWSRTAGGQVEALAYCPTCKLVMTPLPSGYPEYLVCTSCTFKAPFHPEDISSIMDELSTT